MKDDDSESERAVLRKMIANAVDECNDNSLLDLVYKILIADDIQ